VNHADNTLRVKKDRLHTEYLHDKHWDSSFASDSEKSSRYGAVV
jgi:hypothetical protein